MSLWQTHNWQSFLVSSGQSEAFFEVDGVYVEKRKVSFGEYGLFAIGVEKELSEKTLNNLKKLCEKENCLFLQIESLSYTKKDISYPWFSNKYYKKFIPPFTAVIDLSQSEEDILKSKKPKWRYNIWLAEKKWVTCSIVEKNTENISEFYEIFKETTSRDNFAGNTQKYYETFLSSFPESELILAYFWGKVIAGGIFVFGDVSLYYYGASSSENRNLMAPYLVQWTAIQEAKKRGSTLYDFLGVATPGEKHSPLAWVTDFKSKFTSDIREVSQSFLYVHKKKKYFFVMMLKKLVGTIRK